METPDKILFVCTNQRLAKWGKESCGDHGSKDIAEHFRRVLKMRGLNKTLRASASGCLGPCNEGPHAVVMPDNIWYSGFRTEDIEEIVESHLLGGKPVTRLQSSPAVSQQPPEEV
ncbi:MAG: (2Fe-2S) ferredoxin domain-containing protein [Planctomycetota bacterium]|nr:(2Fe-2S) ferredoxin domain-containing protein [Planctomycetota bacterium]